MARRRRPKKRQSPPELIAAETLLRPGEEEEAGEEAAAAEGGGGRRPFRVPPEPTAQEEEEGAARRAGGGGRGGDVSSRPARGPRRRDLRGGGRRGGGGGGSSSRSHRHSFPASRLRLPLPHGMLGAGGGAGARPARTPGRGLGRGGAWGRGRRAALPRLGLASTPRGPRQGSWARCLAPGRGDVCHHPYTHTLPVRPRRHLTLESRSVSGKQESNPRPGVPARAHLHHAVCCKVKIVKKERA